MNAGRYNKHPFHLWWGICWFRENHFRTVPSSSVAVWGRKLFTLFFLLSFIEGYRFKYIPLLRRQDASIGFGAPVRANMRTSGTMSAAVASSLLEYVRLLALFSWRKPTFFNYNIMFISFLEVIPSGNLFMLVLTICFFEWVT